MISPDVLASAEAFVRRVAQQVERVPSLVLDGSWPSVGVVDRMLQPLRLKPELGKHDLLLLHEASAYLAVMIEQMFGVDTPPEVQLTERGITIVMLSPGSQRVRLYLEEAIGTVLAEMPNPLPVTSDFSKYIVPQQGVISPLMLGIFAGDSPQFETPIAFGESVRDRSIRSLAHSSAAWYEFVFPDEQWGRVAELYLEELIYPPSLVLETNVCERSALKLYRVLRDYGASNNTIAALGRNLAQSPDDLLSDVGFILYAAFSSYPVDKFVLAVADSKGSFLAFLRTAVTLVREEAGLGGDWLKNEGLSEVTLIRLNYERELGLHPWLRIPSARFLDIEIGESLKNFVRILAEGSIMRALESADELVTLYQGDPDILAQRAYLDLVAGDPEAALKRLLVLTDWSGTNVSVETVRGLAYLAEQNAEAAAEQFGKALAHSRDLSSLERYQLTNNLAWSLILTESFPEAIEFLNRAVAGYSAPVTALLNEHFLGRELGDEGAASDILERLSYLAPMHRKVFPLLLE